MQTYKITFNMSSPLAMQQTIMFDGLLGYAYFCENGPKEDQNIGRLNNDKPFDFSGMPLEMHQDGYHIASWLFYDKDESAEQVHRSFKKWDESMDYMVEFGKSKKQIAIDRGEFKTTQIPFRVINTPKIWFFFKSCNVGEVERLIEKHIAGIGKNISRGYGFFSSFIIEECNDEFEGNILRPIPAKEGFDVTPGSIYEYRAWRMPYWSPDNFTLCRVH